MFRVIIAGGRDFADYALLSKTMDEYLSDISDDISILPLLSSSTWMFMWCDIKNEERSSYGRIFEVTRVCLLYLRLHLQYREPHLQVHRASY